MDVQAPAGRHAGLDAFIRFVPVRALLLLLLLTAAGAAFATTVEKRTVAAADDAEEFSSGSMYLNSSDLELIHDSSDQTVGMRWAALAIPRGAVITNAYIQFNAKESQSEVTSLTLRGQAADNAATFGSGNFNISTRLRTTESASWAPAPWTAGQAGAAQRTPSLTGLIQEVVNRAGWTSGNALAIIATGTGHRTATAYDGGSSQAPLLHVEFTATAVEAPPIARLSVTQPPTPPLTVSASAAASTDTDLTPIAAYRFDFDDGVTVTTSAPTATASHTYAAAGNHTVTLTATDTGGNSSAPVTASITILVEDAPVARLTVSQPVTPPWTVNADATTSTDADLTPIASYRFDFGDGTPAVTTNTPTATASHAYASAGIHTVTLTVTDTGANYSAPVSTAIDVISQDDPPAARLSVSQPVTPALTVNADASTSTDTDVTPIASYQFDFGDGSPAVTTNPPTATASHAYATAGTYTVTLTATDTGNRTSAPVTASITVKTESAPVARLTLSQPPNPPLTVNANASTSTDADPTPIASYRFDFGDGSPPVATNVPTATASHTYAAAGTYTVTLTATDTGNNTSAPATASIALTTGTITTVEKRTVASADDAEESSSGSMYVNSSDLELIHDSNDQTVGMRWTALAIPRGAIIANAYVQFGAKESQSEVTSLTIRGQAADNATLFASTAGNVSTRPRTTAFASWVPVAWTAGQAGANQRTPSLAALIQEIVNRTAWASGNALAIIINGTGHRTAWAWDGSASGAPLLHVEFTTGAPPTDSPPVARLSVTPSGFTVTADGSTSTDTDATPIASYRFDFGDGTAAVTTTAPAASTSHTYATAGTYTVTLTVTDTGNNVSAPATASVTAVPTTPVADEVHWSIIGQTAVTFDWRGGSDTLRYGTTTGYGQIALASAPSPPPFSSAGPFREARLTGLTQNRLYHYAIGGGADRTFRTPLPRGNSNFTVVAQGDIGAAKDWAAVAPIQSRVAALVPSFVLALGDLTYGNSKGLASVDAHFNDMMMWSQQAAYMPAWGNHEWDIPAADDMRNYKGRFDLPNPQTSPQAPSAGCCGEDWSWFDYGNVRFISYPEPYSGAWSDWQTQVAPIMDAAQADPAIEFIVTFGHRPAYSSGYHEGETELQGVIATLTAGHSKYLLNLNGHSHDYERSYPQSGVMHVTAGTGGSALEDASGSCKWAGGCPAPAWSAFRAMHHVVLKLRFTSGTIEGTAYCGPADAASNDVSCAEGTILDSFIIQGPDRAPVVSAPAPSWMVEHGHLRVPVIASDPDGDTITALSATGLPPGAAFTPEPDNTSGTLTWTPDYGQAGAYTVTFTAANALSGSASSSITVIHADLPPVVTAPASASADENGLLTLSVTASDPDGDAITAFYALELPVGATFTPGTGNTAGALSWTPGYDQAGIHTVSFMVTNALSAFSSTVITVANTDRPPVMTAAPTASVGESQPLTIQVTASDPDGEAVLLTASGLPPGVTFTRAGWLTPNTTYYFGLKSADEVPYWSALSNVIPRTTLAGSDTLTLNWTATGDDSLSGAALRYDLRYSLSPITSANFDAATPWAGLPPPASASAPQSVVVGGDLTGTLSWTPGNDQAGSHVVTFTASNALSASSSTTITVTNTDQAPAVTALATASVAENSPLTVDVTASDPDNDAITSLVAAGLPAGATFTPGTDNLTGQLSWTPGYAQAGSYTVTFTAGNVLSGSSSTVITVTSTDRAPVVIAPATASAAEGALSTVDVTASDPDNDEITTLVATGLPAGATFTPGADNLTGQLSWTPGYAQAGSYTVTFTAGNDLSGSSSTVITVTSTDRAPVVTAPATASVAEGAPLTVDVTVADADGNAITSLVATGLPAGATFTPGAGDLSGQLSWTPGFADAGSYTVTFTAGNDLSGSASTVITVTNADRPPVAVLAATPLTGNEPLLVALDASGSHDPDGPIAFFTFDFGDGSASGPLTASAINHTYDAGSWTATVTVADGGGVVDSAKIEILVGSVPAPNLVANGSFELDTSGWSGVGGALLQTAAGGFEGAQAALVTGPQATTPFGITDDPAWVPDVPLSGARYDVSAWVRSATGTGQIQLVVSESLEGSQIGSVSVTPPAALSAFWQLLRVHFVSSSAGSQVHLQIVDALAQEGESFEVDDVSIGFVTDVATGVDSGAPGLDRPRAWVAPSPLRGFGTLHFVHTRPGPVTIRLFDIRGGIVRQLMDRRDLPPGLHHVALDGRDEQGAAMPSGVYLYRVSLPERTIAGKLLIVR